MDFEGPAFPDKLETNLFKKKDNKADGNCLYESVRDGLAYDKKRTGTGAVWSHEELRRKVCMFYRALFSKAETDKDGYVVNDGRYMFSSLDKLKSEYQVPDHLWEMFMQYCSEFEMVDTEKVDVRTKTTKELRALCKEHGIPSSGTKAELRMVLADMTMQVNHFENICHPYKYSGLADVAVLSITCRLNIVVYNDRNDLTAVFWNCPNCPTIFIQYLSYGHYIALLPKSAVSPSILTPSKFTGTRKNSDDSDDPMPKKFTRKKSLIIDSDSSSDSSKEIDVIDVPDSSDEDDDLREAIRRSKIHYGGRRTRRK